MARGTGARGRARTHSRTRRVDSLPARALGHPSWRVARSPPPRQKAASFTVDLLNWRTGGRLKLRIECESALRDAPDAHRALAGRRTMGKVILLPWFGDKAQTRGPRKLRASKTAARCQGFHMLVEEPVSARARALSAPGPRLPTPADISRDPAHRHLRIEPCCT